MKIFRKLFNIGKVIALISVIFLFTGCVGMMPSHDELVKIEQKCVAKDKKSGSMNFFYARGECVAALHRKSRKGVKGKVIVVLHGSSNTSYAIVHSMSKMKRIS